MLQIKPNCELCDRDLPPAASDARICSYECTFCADCVDSVLHNVCPNCGGGFVPRPIRPTNEHRSDINLEHQPASTRRIHSPCSCENITEFVSGVKDIPPELR